MDDLTLASRIQRRDPIALELLVERHHRPVYRFLRHLTRRSEDAEDLAQATMLRVIGAAGRFDGRSSLNSWILTIAFREYCRFRRRRLWLPLLADRPARDEFGRVEDGEILLAAIAKLPDTLRATFLMHHVEETPIAEIAIVLGVPEGTVKSRLHSARTRLRTLLGEEEPNVIEPCRS